MTTERTKEIRPMATTNSAQAKALDPHAEHRRHFSEYTQERRNIFIERQRASAEKGGISRIEEDMFAMLRVKEASTPQV